MDDGMQWLAGTILSAVISSVITVGFLSALVTRLQIRIDHRNNGIKRVYAPGEHSRTLKKQLAEARAIQLLALSGYGFTHAYRRILTDCVARGGTVEYLLAQPGTAYMKDAAEIEGRGADSISEEVGETLKLLEEFTDQELEAHLKVQKRLNQAYQADVRRSRERFRAPAEVEKKG